MSALRGIAGLAALAGGFAEGTNRQKRMEQDNADREEQRQFQKAQRARMQKEWADEDAYKTELKQAASPLTVEDGTTYQPAVDDEGNTMPANPTEGTFKVGGKRFMTRMEADQAAQADTPEAQQSRVAGVMRKNARFGEAATLENQGLQTKAARLQVDAGERQAERDKALREMGSLLLNGGGWSAVPKVYERYKDGFTAQVQEDGQGGASVTRIDANGKPAGVTKFASLPEFFSRAAGSFDPAKWAADETERQDRKAETDRNQRNSDRDFALRERVAGAQINALNARTDRMGAGGGGKATGPAPVWDDKADTFLRQRYTVTDPTTGETAVDGGGLQFAKQIALAQAMRNGGDTTSGLGYAFEIDQRIKQQAGGDPAKVAAMRRTLLGSLTMQPDSATTPRAPAAPSAPTPKAQAAQPTQTPAQTQQPEAPSQMRQMLSRMGDEASAQGQQMQAIQRRIKQASSGGAPLTREEVALAQQLRISIPR